MVSWLLDGFNALVLSYGQACAGKSTLLVGRGRVLSPSAGGRRAADAPGAIHSPDPNHPHSGTQAEHSKHRGEDIGFAENRCAATATGPSGAGGGAAEGRTSGAFR